MSIRLSRRFWLFAILLAVLAGGLFFWRMTAPVAPLPVRIGIANQPGALLMMIARAQGFFESEGLAPVYLDYPGGKRAIVDGLLAGNVDITTAADVPVVDALMGGRELKVLGVIQMASSVNAIVARKDLGVETIRDLEGRRLGAQKVSAVHYFAHAAHVYHGLRCDQINLAFFKIEDLVERLVAGDVEAISVREPYTSAALEQLGGRGVLLEAPWVYPQYELLLTQAAFLEQQPEVLERVLKALLHAERFAIEEPEKVVSLLSNAFDISADQARAMLVSTANLVSLPQSLVQTMEMQASWITQEVGAPPQSFLSLSWIDSRPLRAVRNEFVSLVE